MADTTLAASTTAKASAAPLVGTDVLRVIRAATSYKATLADVATYVAGAMGALAVVAGSIELGHATDTTLARIAAGRVSIEGNEIATINTAQALTNKTSYNKVAITAPATGSTLTIADGKTLTASNTLTFAGTDGSTLNVGTGGTLGTAAYKNTGTSGNTVPLLDGANVWSGAQVIAVASNTPLVLDGTGSQYQLGRVAGVVKYYSGTDGTSWSVLDGTTAAKFSVNLSTGSATTTGRFFADGVGNAYALSFRYSSSAAYMQIGATNSATPDMIFSNTSGTTILTMTHALVSNFAGNVSILSANPRFNLVNSAGTASTFTIGADSASAYLGTFTAASFTIYTNSTARTTWTSAGVITHTSAGTPLAINSSDSTARKLDFQDNTTLRGSIGADSTYSTVLYNGSGTALSRWTHSNGLMETLFALTVSGVLTPSSGLLGTTGSGAAAAGIVGELLTATATLDTVSLTNAVAANITSLSLTAGDWDVYGEVSYFHGATTVVSRIMTSLSPTSATLDNSMGSINDCQYPASYTPTNNGRITHKVGPICVRLSGTTTYYLVGYDAFTTSTAVAGGRIYARRRR